MGGDMKQIIGMLMAENIGFDIDTCIYFLKSPIKIPSTEKFSSEVELWEVDFDNGWIYLYHGWKQICRAKDSKKIVEKIKKIEETQNQ